MKEKSFSSIGAGTADLASQVINEEESEDQCESEKVMIPDEIIDFHD